MFFIILQKAAGHLFGLSIRAFKQETLCFTSSSLIRSFLYKYYLLEAKERLRLYRESQQIVLQSSGSQWNRIRVDVLRWQFEFHLLFPRLPSVWRWRRLKHNFKSLRKPALSPVMKLRVEQQQSFEWKQASV